MDKKEREREKRAEAETKVKGWGTEGFRKVPKNIFSKFQPEIFLERYIRVKLYMLA
jgi:hypothetical protein